MKKLSLRPYHGAIWLYDSLDQLREDYRHLCREPYPFDDDPKGGRYVQLKGKTVADTKWLVFAATPEALAHEVAHVLLHTFGRIGHNPTNGDGEPFCYMLSQLLREASNV